MCLSRTCFETTSDYWSLISTSSSVLHNSITRHLHNLALATHLIRLATEYFVFPLTLATFTIITITTVIIIIIDL